MFRSFSRLVFPLLLLLFTTSLLAQTAVIRGFVYDKKTGEPIIFTNVFLEGTTLGSGTDNNGFFSITKISAGKYKITVAALGYEKFQEEVVLTDNQIITRKIFLVPAALEIGTVEISAEKQKAKTEVQMSVSKVTPLEIKSLPSVGGEPDIAQYLQVIPGVVFTGDQGGQLYVRGGSPVQNKVMLDGMIIYNPFHSIGLYSVFDTDLIRSADVYTGGFGAKHGGRISSVIDITTRDGNKNKMSGKLSLSPFGAKALIEGPLKKQAETGGSSSFILSARNSYLQQTSKIFYDYVNKNGDGLPFNFMDLYGKISLNSGQGSKINFFGFNFTDQVKYQGISDLSWSNYGAGSNFVLVPAGSPVLIEGNFSYSDYKISLEEPGLQDRTSSVSGFNLGLDFSYFNGDDKVNYGITVLGFSTDYNFFNPYGYKVGQQENTTEIAGYFSYTLNAGLWVIEPGIRGHYYASLSTFSPEPRIGVKYNINEFIRYKAAAGLYSQNLISASSDRDVVNLFYGFLSGPDYLQDTYTLPNGQVKERKNALQRASHVLTGFEFDITPELNVNIEGYYKYFNQLTNINREKLFEDNLENRTRPDSLKKDFIIETGKARGIDLVVNYSRADLDLYLVYSLSRVDRYEGMTRYFPVFDRRHNINFTASYHFGKDKSWELASRLNFGSGFPFTQTRGHFEKLPLDDGIGTDIPTTPGQLGTIYGEYNASRLPAYHRLDISIEKSVNLKNSSKLEMGLSVSNLYNRDNVFYFDRIRFQRVNQLPILPSINISYSF